MGLLDYCFEGVSVSEAMLAIDKAGVSGGLGYMPFRSIIGLRGDTLIFCTLKILFEN